MNNGQRKAEEEAAFIAHLTCFLLQIVIMLDLLIPQKCDLETLPNLLIVHFSEMMFQLGTLLKKRMKRLSLTAVFEEAFTGFYWCHGPMRHEALESFIFIRSKLFVIETFSFHMLNLRCKRCHHYRWLSIYKVYLRCVFNLGTKSGSVLPCSIHRLKYMLYIPVRGTFVGLRLYMQK